MAYNCYGDLRKGEVMVRLREMGYPVKSVNALNNILAEMGILQKTASGWLTTDKGLEYSLGNTPCFNEIAWHATLVEAVAEYLDKNA